MYTATHFLCRREGKYAQTMLKILGAAVPNLVARGRRGTWDVCFSGLSFALRTNILRLLNTCCVFKHLRRVCNTVEHYHHITHDPERQKKSNGFRAAVHKVHRGYCKNDALCEHNMRPFLTRASVRAVVHSSCAHFLSNFSYYPLDA